MDPIQPDPGIQPVETVSGLRLVPNPLSPGVVPAPSSELSEYKITIPRNPEVREMERRAAKRFVARYYGWGSLFAWVVFIAMALLFDLAYTTDLEFKKEPALVLQIVRYVGWMASVVWPLHIVYTYLTFNRRSLAGGGPLYYSETEMAFSSGGVTTDGVTWLPWRQFRALWQFPDCWMLLPSRKEFVPIPAALLDERCREFIERRMLENGRVVHKNPGLGLGLMMTDKEGFKQRKPFEKVSL